VFRTQAEVAEAVAKALAVELLPDALQTLEAMPATDSAAHDAYLRGRFFAPWAGRVEDQSRAVSYFEQAIEIDPEYALAYCGLVDTECFLATWGILATSQIRSEMMATVARALALDDTLAEAHASAGLVATFLNWDWPEGEAAFQRAIQRNPNIASTYDDYARLLVIVGRYDGAKNRYEQAILLNPVSSSHLSGLGVLYAGLGRLSEAETLLQKALKFDKENPEASVWLADVRQKQGRFDDAVRIMERAVFSVDDPELAMRSFLGIAYALAGRMDDARKQLAEMHKSKEEVPDHHVWFGEIHAALGEKDEAFRWLDQALAAREAWLPHVRFDPGTSHIRSDPRFAELHRKMGLGHVDLSLPRNTP
jgi:tetratricopeptide (TPR) repeat protein